MAGITRDDGRSLNEKRPESLAVGELAGAGGSARYRSGGTCALAIIHGPSTAKVSAERYDAATISVSVHRPSTVHTAGGGATRILALRERRLQAADDSRLAALIRRCLMTAVIDIARFPRSVISITVQIVQQDGSVDACCINAVMAALLNASIPCKTTIFAAACGVASVSSGSGEDEQLQAVVDLSKKEEEQPDNENGNSASADAASASRLQLRFLARGTFVFSYPKPFGVVATSGLTFALHTGSAAAKHSTAEVMALLQGSAAVAGNRTLEYMRDQCCGTVIGAAPSNDENQNKDDAVFDDNDE